MSDDDLRAKLRADVLELANHFDECAGGRLMPAPHAGHDQDCHETECPTCREVTPAPDAHRCVIVYPPDSCLQEDK